MEIIFRMHIRSKNEKKRKQPTCKGIVGRLSLPTFSLTTVLLPFVTSPNTIFPRTVLNEIQSIGVEAQKIGS